MRITAEQAGAVWILSGGPRSATADAISQAYVESNFDTSATSSAGYRGLWQCGTDSANLNVWNNGKCAVGKFSSAGNSFVRDWTNFQAPGTEAKRIAYLPRAKIAAARVNRMNETQLRRVVAGLAPAGFIPPLSVPEIPNPFGGGVPDLPDVPNPLEGLGEVAAFLGNIAEIWRGFFDTWLSILRKITDPETWKDAGKILLGFIFLTIAVRRLFTVTT